MGQQVSCASMSGLLDMFMTYLVEFGAVGVVAVGLEWSVHLCAVDAVAVWLKLLVPL